MALILAALAVIVVLVLIETRPAERTESDRLAEKQAIRHARRGTF